DYGTQEIENNFIKQKEVKNRKVSEEGTSGENTKKKLLERGKILIEKETKEQPSQMQIDTEKGGRPEKQKLFTEKRSSDNVQLEEENERSLNQKKSKSLFKAKQKNIPGRNKGDPLHNKKNKITEQLGQGSYHKGEKRSGFKEKEETAYSKTLEGKLEEILKRLEKIEASSFELDREETVGSRGLPASTKKPTTEQSAKSS
ncbi:19786_t:CDS:2, partial [Gigaspora rosea]